MFNVELDKHEKKVACCSSPFTGLYGLMRFLKLLPPLRCSQLLSVHQGNFQESRTRKITKMVGHHEHFKPLFLMLPEKLFIHLSFVTFCDVMSFILKWNQLIINNYEYRLQHTTIEPTFKRKVFIHVSMF